MNFEVHQDRRFVGNEKDEWHFGQASATFVVCSLFVTRPT